MMRFGPSLSAPNPVHLQALLLQGLNTFISEQNYPPTDSL